MLHKYLFLLLQKQSLKYTLFIFSLFQINAAVAQMKWQNVDAEFGINTPGIQVFRSTNTLDGAPFRAFYAIADLQNTGLYFTTDTTLNRRLTPTQYFEKNKSPLLVVNASFFSFATHQNLNLVIKNGEMLGYNIHAIAAKGKDTLTYRHAFNGALGISKNGRADIAWIFSDSTKKHPFAAQKTPAFYQDSNQTTNLKKLRKIYRPAFIKFKKWKMQTAVAGGPVLVQNGLIKVSNNEELKFSGKAINEKHPRTLMGYTQDGKLMVMVVEGRNPGKSEGISLLQAAQLLKDLGCVEALNLDGGGSSCMLINGKETIWPSSNGVQRPVPAVFIISKK